MRAFLVVLGLVLPTVGCSSKIDSTIRVADYDRACVVDRDCVLAIDGDVCAFCANAAIAGRDAKYTADRLRIASACDKGGQGNGDCMSERAVCTAGTCAVVFCEGPQGTPAAAACTAK